MNRFNEIFGYEGSFTTVMEKLFNMIALSAMWLAGCLPIVTVGASTAALYYTVQKSKKPECGYISHEFWRSFCRNLKPGILLWAVIALLTFVVQLNLGIVNAKMEGNAAVFFLILYGLCHFFVTGTQMYLFPALSRFDMPAGWIFKLAVYSCFRHLPITFMLVAITVAAFAAVYHCLPLVLIVPFLANSAYGYFLEPVLKKHMPDAGKGTDKQ